MLFFLPVSVKFIQCIIYSVRIVGISVISVIIIITVHIDIVIANCRSFLICCQNMCRRMSLSCCRCSCRNFSYKSLNIQMYCLNLRRMILSRKTLCKIRKKFCRRIYEDSSSCFPVHAYYHSLSGYICSWRFHHRSYPPKGKYRLPS